MSGWVLVRFGGIALGVITLLGFVSGYLNVEFKPYFASVLKVLQEVAAVIVGAPLWEMLLDELRQHFAWVPKPDPHWKPVYTLSALLMLSLARHGEIWYMIPVALACALVPAVYAGTMPVDSWVVAVWAFAGIAAFLAIDLLRDRYWRVALIPAAGVAAFAAAGYFLGTTGEGTVPLVGLAAVVGWAGLFLLVFGLLFAKGTLSQRLQHPRAATGLDVTATLGLALALGYLFAA